MLTKEALKIMFVWGLTPILTNYWSYLSGHFIQPAFSWISQNYVLVSENLNLFKISVLNLLDKLHQILATQGVDLVCSFCLFQALLN